MLRRLRKLRCTCKQSPIDEQVQVAKTTASKPNHKKRRGAVALMDETDDEEFEVNQDNHLDDCDVNDNPNKKPRITNRELRQLLKPTAGFDW
jgi:hypothetical protein